MNPSEERLKNLFITAESNHILANSEYKTLTKIKVSFNFINGFTKNDSQNVTNLAVEVILDLYEGKLSMEKLLSYYLKTNDYLLHQRIRKELRSLSKTKHLLSQLLEIINAEKNQTELNDLIRELLLFRFKESLEWRTLLKFQYSQNEEVRMNARELVLNCNIDKSCFDDILRYSEDPNINVSNVANELLLKHFAPSLKMKTLIEMQRSNDPHVKSKARFLVLCLTKKKLNYTELLAYRTDKSLEIRALAMELEVINFSELFSWKEIINLQRHQSEIIQRVGKSLAKRVDSSKIEDQQLKLCMASPHKGVRTLASDLLRAKQASLAT